MTLAAMVSVLAGNHLLESSNSLRKLSGAHVRLVSQLTKSFRQSEQNGGLDDPFRRTRMTGYINDAIAVDKQAGDGSPAIEKWTYQLLGFEKIFSFPQADILNLMQIRSLIKSPGEASKGNLDKLHSAMSRLQESAQKNAITVEQSVIFFSLTVPFIPGVSHVAALVLLLVFYINALRKKYQLLSLRIDEPWQISGGNGSGVLTFSARGDFRQL
jgi:hypothetical protein